MNTKHNQFSLGIRVTVPLSPSVPTSAADVRHSSETITLNNEQFHDPTLKVRWNLNSLHDSAITFARCEEQPVAKTSARPPEICM